MKQEVSKCKEFTLVDRSDNTGGGFGFCTYTRLIAHAIIDGKVKCTGKTHEQVRYYGPTPYKVVGQQQVANTQAAKSTFVKFCKRCFTTDMHTFEEADF